MAATFRGCPISRHTGAVTLVKSRTHACTVTASLSGGRLSRVMSLAVCTTLSSLPPCMPHALHRNGRRTCKVCTAVAMPSRPSLALCLPRLFQGRCRVTTTTRKRMFALAHVVLSSCVRGLFVICDSACFLLLRMSRLALVLRIVSLCSPWSRSLSAHALGQCMYTRF